MRIRIVIRSVITYPGKDCQITVARFFTLLEAEALLPQIQTYLRRLLEARERHQAADHEISLIHQRITISGGMIPPRERLLEWKEQKESAARQLKELVEAVQQTGCLLKDLDLGLVDFPTLYRGKEVYLCWKFGEGDISHWHAIEDGYRGRKPIDSEFLTNHKGDEKH